MKISIDPHLYPFLLELAANHNDQVTMVDLGAGTNRLARDLLYRNPTQNAALRNIPSDILGMAREKIQKIVGLEENSEYIAYGKAEDKRLVGGGGRFTH